jgi:3-hydroxybutyryl-CoA dehydrogenase
LAALAIGAFALMFVAGLVLAFALAGRAPGLHLDARGTAQAEQVAAQVSRSAQRLVERGRLSPERMVAMLQHVHPTIALDDLAECDLVIEAVEEHDGERFEVFAALSETVKPSTMLATAGSATSVIDCAMATARPERVVGLHFFTPAPMMQLVEVETTVRMSLAMVRVVSVSSSAFAR